MFNLMKKMFCKEQTKKPTKCKECNLKEIRKIMWHDLVVNKCDTCRYVALTTDKLIKLGYNIILEYNIADIKRKPLSKYTSSKETKKLHELLTIHRIGVKHVKLSESPICDKCHTDLAFFKNKFGFTYFYCPECGTFYFLQEDYDKMIEEYVKK